jgi:hypothetical protein
MKAVDQDGKVAARFRFVKRVPGVEVVLDKASAQNSELLLVVVLLCHMAGYYFRGPEAIGAGGGT